jgi:hypothetical protein
MAPAESATMGGMAWGRKDQTAKVQTVRRSTARNGPGPDPDPDVAELRFCCICGALLGFDQEDEINGEGPGRDICGPCNRTKNDDAIMWGW